MIDAKSLMVGNWVAVGNNNVKVNDIGDTGINISWYHELTDYDYKFEDLSPIPLTPKILVKCGGYSNGFGGYGIIPLAQFWIIFYEELGKWEIDINSDFPGNVNREIKYLHQLQNLYFALTQKELEIKLKINEQ